MAASAVDLVMKRMTYKHHPATKLFPMLSESELGELAADIGKHGLIDPIVLHDGMVLDGRNRLAACDQVAVAPRFVQFHGSSPVLYVVSKNLYRRHLTTGQRSAIGADSVPMLQEEAKKRQHQGRPPKVPVKSPEVMGSNETNEIKGDTRDIAGKAAGVSGFMVQRAITVKNADPEEYERIKRGETTVGAAMRKVRGEPPATKRQGQRQNAHKRRMIDVLSQITGLCRWFERVDLPLLRSACTKEEIRTWAKTASSAAKELRRFAATFEQKGNT